MVVLRVYLIQGDLFACISLSRERIEGNSIIGNSDRLSSLKNPLRSAKRAERAEIFNANWSYPFTSMSVTHYKLINLLAYLSLHIETINFNRQTDV